MQLAEALQAINHEIDFSCDVIVSDEDEQTLDMLRQYPDVRDDAQSIKVRYNTLIELRDLHQRHYARFFKTTNLQEWARKYDDLAKADKNIFSISVFFANFAEKILTDGFADTITDSHISGDQSRMRMLGNMTPADVIGTSTECFARKIEEYQVSRIHLLVIAHN